MRRPRAAAVAWAIWALTLLGFASSPLLALVPDDVSKSGAAALISAFTAFATVGALIVSRRPGNRLGWVFAGIGAISGANVFSSAYAYRALVTDPGSLPLGTAAAWIESWGGAAVGGLIFTFSLLLFPTGRPPSARWRPVAWASGIFVVLGCAGPALAPKLSTAHYSIDNPVGLSAGEGLRGVIEGASLFSAILAFLCALSLILRFRGSRGDERLQVKWFAFAGSVLASMLLVSVAFPFPQPWSDIVFGAAFTFLPISAGIAILKYRLYDIDVIINRTLVYGALTALLVLVYMAGVFGFGGTLRSLTGQQDNGLAVAASTLVVAALFRPARSRIQSFIDHRFYRRKYDAAQTLEAFSGRLRDEVDLDALGSDLLTVVGETVQPAHASLWLRTSETGELR